MSAFKFSLSVYLSLAAHYQALAFKCTSERSIKRNARLADHWYRCAEYERRYPVLARAHSGRPIFAQENCVQLAIKYFARVFES
jgi:hypothetical protein